MPLGPVKIILFTFIALALGASNMACACQTPIAHHGKESAHNGATHAARAATTGDCLPNDDGTTLGGEDCAHCQSTPAFKTAAKVDFAVSQITTPGEKVVFAKMLDLPGQPLLLSAAYPVPWRDPQQQTPVRLKIRLLT
jgi:hypothetical protein